MKPVIKRKQLSDQISELATNRLAVYLRCLNTLDAAGVKTVSSQALAHQFHLNAARSEGLAIGESACAGWDYSDLQQNIRQISGSSER